MKHLVLILSQCLVIVSSLSPPPNALVTALLGPNPLTADPSTVHWEVAHRAAANDAPENSLEAVRLAAENGAKWVEFDISFTKDNVAVAFHDDTLDRMTTASGPISSYTYEELSKLDLGVKHPSNMTGVRIPTVDQFISLCLSLNIKMIIDLKSWKSPRYTRDFIISLYNKYPGLSSNAMVTSFFPHLLYLLRSESPNITCSISSAPHLVPSFLSLFYPTLADLASYKLVGLSAILAHKSAVTKEYVAKWSSRGVRVMAWTVDDPVEKKYMKDELKVQVLTDTVRKK